MSITDWPEGDRPRERLLVQGATALSDAELLAIFLRVGVTGLSAVDLARYLLIHFDGLNGLLTATQDEFCQVKGVGTAKYAQIQASLELTRRFLACELVRDNAMNSPQKVRDYLASRLQDKQEERFLLLLLDSQHRVIADSELSRGTIAAANVYPREVVKAVLAKNAAAVILAHNHPSGVAEPSQADRDITARIQQALNLIDVTVLDHLVIGVGHSCSFAERGWL